MNKRERDIMRDGLIEDLVKLVELLVDNQSEMMKKLDKLEKSKNTRKTSKRSLQ